MKILITGVSGYLGSVISEHLLNAGHQVVGLDNLYYNQNSLFHLCGNPNFDFQIGDARDESLLKRLLKEVDAIIPLASIVGAPACNRDQVTAKSLNFDAVLLLNKLRSASQMIVYPTTNSGYGTTDGNVYCTEETPLEPISLYGRTKVEAEKALLDSPNTITLRLATVFGVSPRMRIDLLVNHFTYAAFTDGYIVIFEKHFKRNYIHVRDVADCFIHCLANFESMSGQAYNVGLDEANLNKEELALTIKEKIPNFYIHFAEFGSDPDKRNYIVSNEKLAATGFKASRSIESGIDELIKCYKMLGRPPFRNI